jgi:hypothetical protein
MEKVSNNWLGLIERRMKCRHLTQKATASGQQNRLQMPLLIWNKPGIYPVINYQLKSARFGRTYQRLITDSNIHKFGVQRLRIQGKLSRHKPIRMTKICLFLPINNIAMFHNALQKAVITKAIMTILRRKCGFWLPILNDHTS